MDGRPSEPPRSQPNFPSADPRPSAALTRWTRPGSLAANLTLFGRRLRGRGLLVGPAEIGLALTALETIDVTDRDAVRLALRTVLCSRAEDLPAFDEEFERFWQAPAFGPVMPGTDQAESESETDMAGEAPEGRRAELTVTDWAEEGTPSDDERSVPAYSPAEVRAAKDFSAFAADDLEEITELIMRIARRIAMRLSRRMRAARRGERVDLRRTMRRSLQYGGDPAALVWRRRKIRKVRIVLLCDVSGSMDVYSRFLVQFVYALQGVVGRVESFLFSTSLTRVTDALAHRDIRHALAEASRYVPDWSGGTKIGASLRTFNEQYGSLVDGRTIVVIASDGWDTGDLDVLVSAMRVLRARAGRVIWLNPLLGSPGYEPVTQGMAAALPFVDVFASAHNLASLRVLERHLRRPRGARGRILAARRRAVRIRPAGGTA
ncbi:MAG TPA: VWA domain-containing protein [bacterium]|nr:VWA domain-containing protein [bacterium]